MAEYAGSRRATAALTGAESQRAFAADDATLNCPECGSLVRADQQWCTLCLHVLHQPEPEPEPQPEPQPETESLPAPPAVAGAPVGPVAGTATTWGLPTSTLTPEAEAAAAALLEQLAIETRREGLHLPSYLQSKAQKAVAVAIAMSVLSGVVLLLMSVLGAVFH